MLRLHCIDRIRRARTMGKQLHQVITNLNNKLPEFEHLKERDLLMKESKNTLYQDNILILITGANSCGKSSIVNNFLGKEIASCGEGFTSFYVTYYHQAETFKIVRRLRDCAPNPVVNSENEFFYTIDEWELDAYDIVMEHTKRGEDWTDEIRDNEAQYEIHIYGPFPHLPVGVALIDSPGWGESDAINESIKMVFNLKPLVVNIYGHPTLLSTEMGFIQFLSENYPNPPPILYIANKADRACLKEYRQRGEKMTDEDLAERQWSARYELFRNRGIVAEMRNQPYEFWMALSSRDVMEEIINSHGSPDFTKVPHVTRGMTIMNRWIEQVERHEINEAIDIIQSWTSDYHDGIANANRAVVERIRSDFDQVDRIIKFASQRSHESVSEIFQVLAYELSNHIHNRKDHIISHMRTCRLGEEIDDQRRSNNLDARAKEAFKVAFLAIIAEECRQLNGEAMEKIMLCIHKSIAEALTKEKDSESLATNVLLQDALQTCYDQQDTCDFLGNNGGAVATAFAALAAGTIGLFTYGISAAIGGLLGVYFAGVIAIVLIGNIYDYWFHSLYDAKWRIGCTNRALHQIDFDSEALGAKINDQIKSLFDRIRDRAIVRRDALTANRDAIAKQRQELKPLIPQLERTESCCFALRGILFDQVTFEESDGSVVTLEMGDNGAVLGASYTKRGETIPCEVKFSQNFEDTELIYREIVCMRRTADTVRMTTDGIRNKNGKPRGRCRGLVGVVFMDDLEKYDDIPNANLLSQGDRLPIGIAIERLNETLRDRVSEDIKNGSYDLHKSVSYMMQISRILEDLDQAGVIHLDLGLHNFYVTKNGEVVLGNFGQSNCLQMCDYSDSQRDCMAPEVLTGEDPTCKADIFSAGIMFWELLPRPCLINGNLLAIRNSMPSDTPDDLASIIRACCSQDRNDRPTAAKLSQLLDHHINP